MRIGGLASGMDIDNMVDKLMEAERMPLEKMEQDQTTYEWKRDAFRDVNKTLAELDDKINDMTSRATYQNKSISSSQEDAVTAEGSSAALDGTYRIKVNELATKATNMSKEAINVDPDASLKDELGTDSVRFTTFDENGEKSYSYDIDDDDTLEDVLQKITNDDNHVRAFYDASSEKVIMETTRTGNYSGNDSKSGSTDAGGKEIQFEDDDAFFRQLNLKNDREEGGTDAEFEYNGIVMSSHDNTYELGGVTFKFNDKTTGNGANITVTNDVEESFSTIMDFVDTYNDVVEKLNESQQEEKHRDYPPLTDEQKEEMTDHEIELWEDKAKSGILRGESVISQGLSNMRSSWYHTVNNEGSYDSVTEIGIATTSNYLDGGKLEVDEAQLKEALATDPDSVYQLFNAHTEEDGVMHRLGDALEGTMSQIEQRAGKGTDTLNNYTIGRRMKDLNEQIADFEDRMADVEQRYWDQFTQMEQAIQQMNQQSQMLTQKFGGGGLM